MTQIGYRQRPGLSGTQLVKLAKSPLHYKHAVDNPSEPTPAMEFGTAAHTLVLEPQLFSQQYAVFQGEGTRASKEYKAFALANSAKSILKQEEYQDLQQMLTALQGKQLASRLLFHEQGLNEHEMYWVDPATQVQCKGKLDRYLPDLNIVVDYKTANDASAQAFNKYKAHSLGYYLQAAHYQAGIKHTHQLESVPAFVFVVQETEAPFDVKVYELDQQSIDEAHAKRDELLQVYGECMRTGVWYGYSEEMGKI